MNKIEPSEKHNTLLSYVATSVAVFPLYALMISPRFVSTEWVRELGTFCFKGHVSLVAMAYLYCALTVPFFWPGPHMYMNKEEESEPRG